MAEPTLNYLDRMLDAGETRYQGQWQKQVRIIGEKNTRINQIVSHTTDGP